MGYLRFTDTQIEHFTGRLGEMELKIETFLLLVSYHNPIP